MLPPIIDNKPSVVLLNGTTFKFGYFPASCNATKWVVTPIPLTAIVKGAFAGTSLNDLYLTEEIAIGPRHSGSNSLKSATL